MLMHVLLRCRGGVRWWLLGTALLLWLAFLLCVAAVPSFQAGVIRMIRAAMVVAAILTTRADTVAAAAAMISVAPTLPRRRATTTLRVTATVPLRPRRECRSLTATTIDRPEEDTASEEAEAAEQQGAVRRANDRDPGSDALKRASISCLALRAWRPCHAV
jgi:hypothetical protein